MTRSAKTGARLREFLLLAGLFLPATANATTLDNGVLVVTQADALAGNVTPGDTPGFPITISVPGSYRLGSNLSVPDSAIGFSIPAAEVTLDLAGFRIIGSGTGTRAVEGSGRALTVRNGTVRAFASGGVYGYGPALTVEEMRFENNQGAGVYAAGPNARIRENLVMTGQFGIECSQNCAVSDNLISGLSVGIATVGSALILGNMIGGSQNRPIAAGTGTPGSIGTVGLGDNYVTIFTNPSTGTFLTMAPNACDPQC